MTFYSSVRANRTINLKTSNKSTIHKFQYTFIDSRNNPDYFSGEYLSSYFPLPENMVDIASGILIQLPDVVEQSPEGQSIKGIGFTIDIELSFSFPGGNILKSLLQKKGLNTNHIIQQVDYWGTNGVSFYQLMMPIKFDDGKVTHEVTIPPTFIKSISICFNHAYPNNLELTDVGYIFNRNFKSEYWGYAKLFPINNLKVYGSKK